MNTNAGEERKFVPPYISFRTLLNLVQRMADDGTPPRIDRSFLSGSEGGKTQVLAALRGLGFIDTDGNVQPLLTEMIDNPGDRAKIIKRLLEENYPKPVHLGTVNATQGQLEEAFKEFGIKGDTMRKAVAFYLRAAEFAGLPVSSNFKTPSIQRADGTAARRTTPRPKVKRESGARNDASANGGGDGGTKLPNVHPGLAGVLGDLPPRGHGWTEEEKAAWKAAFDAMLDYSIEVVDEAEGENENDEFEEETADELES